MSDEFQGYQMSDEEVAEMKRLRAIKYYCEKHDAHYTAFDPDCPGCEWESEAPLRDVESGAALERHLDYLCFLSGEYSPGYPGN